MQIVANSSKNWLGAAGHEIRKEKEHTHNEIDCSTRHISEDRPGLALAIAIASLILIPAIFTAMEQKITKHNMHGVWIMIN